MAEDILLPENKQLITKQELIDSGFMIIKKLVMVDSTDYTPEAFDYILELADLVGSIVFVSDSKKIYANGRYFGGDIFQADLLYFTDFITTNENGNITGISSAKHPKSTLNIKTKGHLQAKADYDETTGKNSIEFNYDLNSAVDTEQFTMDSNAKYNLAIVDGKIKMIKYIPCGVNLSSLPILEYDSGETVVNVGVNYSGSKEITEVKVSCDPMYFPEDPKRTIITEGTTNNNIILTIPNNTDVLVKVKIKDGVSEAETSTKQIWGYGIFYGKGLLWNIENMSKYLISNNPSKTIIIEQNEGEYGYFACPKEFNVVFTDVSTNLQGGWSRIDTFLHYSFNTEYQVYRTDNTGLGYVKWNVSKK